MKYAVVTFCSKNMFKGRLYFEDDEHPLLILLKIIQEFHVYFRMNYLNQLSVREKRAPRTLGNGITVFKTRQNCI